MGRILFNAVTNYREEVEDLLVIAAPAIVLGPILVIFASSGLRAALVTIPAFLLLYLFAFAACVRAAGLLKQGLRPEPLQAYFEVFKRSSAVLRAAAPGAVLVGLISGAALVVSDVGPSIAALGVGFVGAVAAFVWGRRNAYHQPLILVHGFEADQAAGLHDQVTGENMLWTTLLVALLSAPVVVVLMLSWGLAAALGPPFGAIVFAVALGLWLPFLALSLTTASEDLFGRVTR